MRSLISTSRILSLLFSLQWCGQSRRGSGAAVGVAAYHLVNVFCWTLTHCCSSGAMIRVHQGSGRDWAHAGRNIYVSKGGYGMLAGDYSGVFSRVLAQNNEWLTAGAASAVAAPLSP
jgi:hypothetical protein